MKSRFFTFILLGLAATASLQAQDEAAAEAKTFTWKSDLSLQFSSSYFSTYQVSGNNNNVTSVIGKFNFLTHWGKGKQSWDNELKTLFGQSYTQIRVEEGNSVLLKRALAKNGDFLGFTTKYGYNIGKSMNVTLLGNLQTQFTAGFRDPFATTKGQIPVRISDFFAPAVTNVALGIDYKPNDDFSIFYSPANWRSTIVSVPELRSAYSVDTIAGVRHEFGSLFSLSLRKELMKNIVYSTKLTLFTNYLKNEKNPEVARPFAVDVQLWQHNLNFQINKYVSASFSANIMYDEDTKFDILTGNKKDGLLAGYKAPRTQYFHNFGIGFGYILSNEKK